MADHQFPLEIIYEILSRLPIKSLGRFRCVSKSWLEYINDPHLETIHVKHELTPIMFQQLHPNLQCKISFLRVLQGTSSTVKKDPVLKYCCKEYLTLSKLVLGSCNGLTLVSYENNPSHGTFLALINPLNKQVHNLPPVKIRCAHVHRFYPAHATGIGFDDSTNTLKTVCVFLKQVAVYSPDISVVRTQPCTAVMVHYSGTGSWREIAQVPAYPISGAGVFARGRLYWKVSSHYWSLEEGTQVVWFDVKTEEFGLIDPPKRRCYWVEDQLVDLNGEVGFAYIDNSVVELWILKQGEWDLLYRFDLYPQPACNYFVVVSGCWNQFGDMLLTTDCGRRLLVYTPKTGDLRQVVDWGDRYSCVADIRMYRSSLFSIRTGGY